jgi:hypothetical protein
MTQSSAQSTPIVTGTVEQQRPAGLFYRLKVDLTSGGRLEIRTLLFLPGNRISRTFPFGGAAGFDASRCNPDTCGTYQWEPTQITVRWDNGQVDRWSYRQTADGIDVDGDSFKPARTVSAATLAGTWAGAATTSNSAQNVYAFGADGTFTFGTGTGGVGGRYTVQGLTLTLAFADGTQQRRTLFAAGSSEPLGLICVEGDAYRRR